MIPPPAWLATLERRSPLVLAPDGARGWFGGRSIVAFDPVDGGVMAGNGPGALAAAGDVLERARAAREPLLAVALLPYSGDVRWALYACGAELTPTGWRWWGREPADGWPELPPAAPAREPAGLGAQPDADARLSQAPLATAMATSLETAGFAAAVEATREAIAAGDVYVLNLTRTVEALSALSPAELFTRLTDRAPASMAAAWLPDGAGCDGAILSASPERFVRITGHEIEIAPVKGTRPRGGSAEEDAGFVAELGGSEKERAEHVMVVDLERNDVGRVCVPGSVRVDPLYAIETTSYCYQAVSSVRGLLREDTSLGDVLSATFPCGSITGAPKIAAMRIASELESGDRGAYTGSLLVAVPGEIDSSVLIRTAEVMGVSARGTRVRYGTGCGITIDSDAAEEWRESELKTAPLLGDAARAGEGTGTARGPVAGGAAAAGAARTAPLRETCRVAGGRVPLWPLHRARLARGGVGDELLDEITARVDAAAAEWAGAGTHRARLTVTVGAGGDVAVDVAQRLSSLDVIGGVRVERVDVTGPPPLPHPVAKPADRRYWDAAHHKAERGKAHQAVLVDADGNVMDGSTACVWVVEDGELVTPPAPPAIPSVSRAFVAAQALAAGLVVRVEPISWQRFERADEAFFTNAFGGAAAVRDRGGAVFSAVKGYFDEVWRDEGIEQHAVRAEEPTRRGAES